MAGEIARLFARIGVDTREFDKGMKSVRGGLMDVDRAVKQVGSFMGGYFALQMMRGAVAMTEASARAMRLEQSFRQLTKAPDAMLAALKRASNGAVSETSLILGANRAMLLGVSKDAEQLARLLEVARFRGRAMGLDTQQAFSDIVTGIGRQSALILDNLGIVVDAENTYKRYAASVGKAASALTESEKRQALLNAVLDDGRRQIEAAGRMADDAADQFEQMAAKVEDAKTKLGEFVLKTGIMDVTLNFITKGVIGGIETMDAIDTINKWAAEHHTTTMTVLTNMVMGAPVTPAPGAVQPWPGAGEAGPGQLTAQQLDTYMETGQLPEGYSAAPNPFGLTVAPTAAADLAEAQRIRDANAARWAGMGAAAQPVAGPPGPGITPMIPITGLGLPATDAEAQRIRDTAAARWQGYGTSGGAGMDAYKRTVNPATPPQYIYDPEAFFGGFIDAQQAAKEFAEKFKKQTGPILDRGMTSPFMKDEDSAALHDLRMEGLRMEADATKRATTEAERYWKANEAAAKSAYDAVLNIAGGAFKTPDDSTRFGLVGTPFQMGESWDENARRALDVGNLGKASPWFAQFAGQFAGLEGNQAAMQARAAQIAADIRESPTMPEIGQEGYKALVDNAKRNIMNQVAMEDLKTKIAADLMSDPAAMAGMKKLGIDVDAAMKSVGEQQVDQLKAMQKQTNVFVTNWKGGGGDTGGGATPTGSKTFIPGVGYVESHASGGVVGWGLPRGTPVLSLDHAGEVVSNGRQPGGRSFYFAPGSINVSGVKDLSGFIQQLEALRSMQG